MKNKLKIVLCVVMIAVFSFGSCSVVYAKTGQPSDISVAWNIVKSYYLDETHDANSSYYFISSFSPVVLFSYNGLSYLLVDVDCPDSYSFNDYGKVNHMTCPKVFTFDSMNMYSCPSGFSRRAWFGDSPAWAVPYLTPDLVNSGDVKILGSYFDFLDTSGEVVFLKGTNSSPNPTNPDSSTQGSNILSNLLSKVFQTSGTIYQEIVALLPILLPVLIAFLAIRKGIRFTLQTLRSA